MQNLLWMLKEFMQILNNSELSIPDGAGPLYAHAYYKKLQGVKRNILFPIKAFIQGIGMVFNGRNIGEKLSGSSLIYDMCELAEKNNYTIFLLGGWEKDKWGNDKKDGNLVAEKAADKLRQLYPKLNIVGATSNYRRDSSDDNSTLEYIHDCMIKKNVSNIDLLFVAYGHKHQERWIERSSHLVPAILSVGVGGTFDYVIGSQVRANDLFIRRNLEWLHRLITQPWRFKRIFKAFPLFPIFLYLSTLKDSKSRIAERDR